MRTPKRGRALPSEQIAWPEFLYCGAEKRVRSARSTNDAVISGSASRMTVNRVGRSTGLVRGSNGASPDGWAWAINLDRRFGGQESTSRRRRPQCRCSSRPRQALAVRGGSGTENFFECKGDRVWKARALPLCVAIRCRPLQRDGTRSSTIIFG
jgi:hypothetical protein